MKNKVKGIVATIFFVVFIVIIIGFLYISSGLDMERQPVINGVDLSGVADGTYSGHYKGGRWTNDVSVTVAGGKIVYIQIVKDVTFPDENTSDTLFRRVIEQQTTAVDTVSGATVTSKAYLKAIENAFAPQKT
jgi:uncharacterized protein with FMN-binding domain